MLSKRSPCPDLKTRIHSTSLKIDRTPPASQTNSLEISQAILNAVKTFLRSPKKLHNRANKNISAFRRKMFQPCPTCKTFPRSWFNLAQQAPFKMPQASHQTSVVPNQPIRNLKETVVSRNNKRRKSLDSRSKLSCRSLCNMVLPSNRSTCPKIARH
jgi:hypothetical protein